MSRPDAERVWLAFAQHALTGLASQMVTVDPLASSWAQVNRGISDDAADLADEMLERWRMRYGDDPPSRVVTPAAVPAPEPAPTTDAIDW